MNVLYLIVFPIYYIYLSVRVKIISFEAFDRKKIESPFQKSERIIDHFGHIKRGAL